MPAKGLAHRLDIVLLAPLGHLGQPILLDLPLLRLVRVPVEREGGVVVDRVMLTVTGTLARGAPFASVTVRLTSAVRYCWMRAFSASTEKASSARAD